MNTWRARFFNGSARRKPPSDRVCGKAGDRGVFVSKCRRQIAAMNLGSRLCRRCCTGRAGGARRRWNAKRRCTATTASWRLRHGRGLARAPRQRHMSVPAQLYPGVTARGQRLLPGRDHCLLPGAGLGLFGEPAEVFRFLFCRIPIVCGRHGRSEQRQDTPGPPRGRRGVDRTGARSVTGLERDMTTEDGKGAPGARSSPETVATADRRADISMRDIAVALYGAANVDAESTMIIYLPNHVGNNAHRSGSAWDNCHRFRCWNA